MKTYRWTVNVRDLEKIYIKGMKSWDRYYMLRDIDRRKYFEGFKVGKEKKMFQEELKDLESVYQKTLESVEEKLSDVSPALLHYMEQFVELNKQKEVVSEKLEALLEKTGRGSQEENCGGCNE